MPPPTPVRADADPLHVTAPQRPSGMHHLTLHHRSVPDQLLALPHQGMHTTQGMVPVLVGHVAFEDVVEEGFGRGAGAGVEFGGVGEEGVCVGHGGMIPERVGESQLFRGVKERTGRAQRLLGASRRAMTTGFARGGRWPPRAVFLEERERSWTSTQARRSTTTTRTGRRPPAGPGETPGHGIPPGQCASTA
ncbi:hypothetical protein DF17_30890 [Streptomyces rimosus]|nr:hypothetical protein DF17_30890 [Streptomyces rimosus]